MRRLWMSFFVGSAITAAGAAVAGGLPETGSAAGATAGSTDQAAAPAATAAAATATTTSTAASGQTATAAANTSSSQSTEVASSASPDEGGVETGSFIAIEDDPLIIDASSVVASVKASSAASYEPSMARAWPLSRGPIRKTPVWERSLET